MTTTVVAVLHSMSDACQALSTVPGTLYKETEAWKSEVTCLTEGPSANAWHSLNNSMIPRVTLLRLQPPAILKQALSQPGAHGTQSEV